MRIALIGSGPSGMQQLCAFKEAQKEGAQIPEIVCFEKQDQIGGLWNYNWRTGIDVDGTPVHNSMYRHLWSNGPKECLEFPDYTFEEHFGELTASYPPRQALRDYLEGYCKKKEMPFECIRFNSIVKRIDWQADQKKFELRIKDQTTEYTEVFDKVIVATGHFSTPHMPHFKGLEDFSGQVLHAHDFRDGAAFKGQRILIVGASYSSEDITSQLYKYGSKQVIITHRKKDPQGKWMPMGFAWPDGIEERPLLNNVSGKMISFEDGSQAEIDVVLMCTGYRHNFPFLNQDLTLESENKLWITALKNGVMSEKNENLYFLSMQNQFYTYVLFAAEARYVRDLIMGKISRDEPLKDTDGKIWDNAEFEKTQNAMTCAKDGYEMQGKYVECLMIASKWCTHIVEPLKYTQGINQTFTDWCTLKAKDIMTFRNYGHASLVTGKMAAQPHETKQWLKAQGNESVEFYKNLHKE